jgi:hypothetical protein
VRDLLGRIQRWGSYGYDSRVRPRVSWSLFGAIGRNNAPLPHVSTTYGAVKYVTRRESNFEKFGKGCVSYLVVMRSRLFLCCVPMFGFVILE